MDSSQQSDTRCTAIHEPPAFIPRVVMNAQKSLQMQFSLISKNVCRIFLAFFGLLWLQAHTAAAAAFKLVKMQKASDEFAIAVSFVKICPSCFFFLCNLFNTSSVVNSYLQCLTPGPSWYKITSTKNCTYIKSTDRPHFPWHGLQGNMLKTPVDRTVWRNAVSRPGGVLPHPSRKQMSLTHISWWILSTPWSCFASLSSSSSQAGFKRLVFFKKRKRCLFFFSGRCFFSPEKMKPPAYSAHTLLSVPLLLGFAFMNQRTQWSCCSRHHKSLAMVCDHRSQHNGFSNKQQWWAATTMGSYWVIVCNFWRFFLSIRAPKNSSGNCSVVVWTDLISLHRYH